MTDSSAPITRYGIATTRADGDVLRRLTGQVYLRERLDPDLPQHTLPHRADPQVALQCAMEGKLRRDGHLLADVAPFVLTSRPVVVQR